MSTLDSIKSNVNLVEYPPGDYYEYTLDSIESQPRKVLFVLKPEVHDFSADLLSVRINFWLKRWKKMSSIIVTTKYEVSVVYIAKVDLV